MTTSTTTTSGSRIDPALLKIHPLIADTPAMADDSEEFEALCLSVQKDGIIEPLKITEDHQIVDGRHRWRAARRLRLESVPVAMVPPEQVMTVAVTTLLNRRHYTKGQRAYLLVPFIADSFAEAERLMRAGKTPPNPRNSVSRVKTPEEWAAEFGFTVQLLRQAREVHRIFAEDAEYKALMEARLLSSEGLGLGAVIAGFAGQKATKGKEKSCTDSLHLFTRTFHDFRNRLEYWPRFDLEARAAARAEIQKTVAAMPVDLRKVFSSAIRSAAKVESRKSSAN